MLMVWDEAKRERNRLPEPEGHGLDFVDARDRFEWDSAVISPARRSSAGAARFVALGYLDGKLRALVFAPLGTEAISAISLRPISRKERRIYVEARR